MNTGRWQDGSGLQKQQNLLSHNAQLSPQKTGERRSSVRLFVTADIVLIPKY